MKILYFFLYLWVIFALLDPDPDPATQINADPDPQLWFFTAFLVPLAMLQIRSFLSSSDTCTQHCLELQIVKQNTEIGYHGFLKKKFEQLLCLDQKLMFGWFKVV